MKKESNIDYWNYCIDRSNEAATDSVAFFFVLSSISKSLANIADSLEEIKGSVESISDNMWAEGSNL